MESLLAHDIKHRGNMDKLADLEPQVAFRCGKPSVYLSLEGGSRAGWIRDSDQGCVDRLEDVLAFCKRVYPKLASNFSGVVPSASVIQIHNWCDFNQKRCESRSHNIHLVRPFKCLTTRFVPEALLVPDTCSFGHVFSPAINRQCRPLDGWRQEAEAQCKTRVNKTVLFSMGVLTPCVEDRNKVVLNQRYAGVEFVCCSEKVQKNAAPHEYVVDLSEPTKNSVLATHQDVSQPASESKDDFLVARVKLEKEEAEKERQLEATFKKGMERLSELKENDEAVERLVDQLKRRFSQKFEETLSEEVAKWRNLEVQQEEKLTSSIIKNLESLRAAFMTAIGKENPKTSDLWPALRKFVSAVMQAKLQALNFFSHLIVNDPAEAGRDRQLLNERFTRLNLALEEILAELKRTPQLEGELKRKAHELTRKYDNLDMSKNILLSASINTEKEKSKPKLLVDGEARKRAFLSQFSHEGKVLMTHRKQIVFAHDRNPVNSMKEQASYLNPPSDHHLSVKQMALHHTKAQAEPVSSVTEDWASYQMGSLIGGLVAGMALLLLVLVVVLAVRHRQERPHGGYVMSVVELSPDDEQGICPNIQSNGEERHLANMQINGYENPTYKFFEKQ